MQRHVNACGDTAARRRRDVFEAENNRPGGALLAPTGLDLSSPPGTYRAIRSTAYTTSLAIGLTCLYRARILIHVVSNTISSEEDLPWTAPRNASPARHLRTVARVGGHSLAAT
jgi:hypothetical protein